MSVLVHCQGARFIKKNYIYYQMIKRFKNCIVLLLLIKLSNTYSQTLNLPAHPANALTGSQFVATISSSSMSLTTRENLIYTEISNGNVPAFYRTLVPVTSTAVISGSTQSVTYYVIPDYLAVGTDTNYFLCPMSPMLATQIGNLTGCTLPTRKMVNNIWSAATVKLSPSPITASPSMTTVPVFDQHNTTVKGQRQAFSNSLGELVSGDKKDVVISNQIYSTANRVVIYGWHYTSGTAIQPLSNVHADTYMDYSHGIRLVQNSCMLNGTTSTTVKAILQSSTLNTLLSDEGQMNQPYYPYYQTVTQLVTPVSFAITRNTSTSLKIKVTNDVDVTDYKVYTSSDGINFNAPITLAKTNLTVTGLTTNTICYVKIAAYNSTYAVTSGISEVLAAVPSSINDSILIVNGFDRASTGNTFNFVIQHGSSFYNNQHYFESATNEAVINGLVSLTDYKVVDYILGKESSTNETFSSIEQSFVSNYLKQGGHLFVSGSEIGWDLDHLGSASDKAFYNDYLKSTYISDAPNNAASSFYKGYTNNLSSTIFNTIDSINFDNGTNGTYNVDYPDVINTVNGSVADVHYSTSVTDIAGVHFAGLFNGGTANGKLVYICFPFETIYNQAKRDSCMNKIIYFFEHDLQTSTSIDDKEISFFENVEVYPNPSNANATIYFNLNKQENVSIELYDVQGNKVLSVADEKLEIGEHTITFNRNNLTSGIYFLSLKTIHEIKNIRLILID
jgi:hypothetical protein